MDRVTPTLVHRIGNRLLGLFCFNRISVFGAEGVRGEGAVLYLALHRNGAVDGIPYLMAAPCAAYMVSAQLQRSWVGRKIFPGIGVARRKDRERAIHADNHLAIQSCVSHLAAGGHLFILPEGTSSLGPRHLPFRSGALVIALEALKRGLPLHVIPVAVNYECAWEWQSRVEVVIGEPMTLTLADAVSTDELAARTTAALERIGINVATEAELRLLERVAFAATCVSVQSYSRCLKHFESNISREVRETDARVQEAVQLFGARTYQGVPLLPRHGMASAGAWLAIAPVIACCFLLNAPPAIAGVVAGRKLPDDMNVIAFWRTAIGAPSALLWCLVLVVGLIAFGHVFLAGLYLGVSVLGVRLSRRFRMLSVALYNSFFASHIRGPLAENYASVCRSLEPARG